MVYIPEKTKQNSTNNIDLNFDAKGAFGEYLPTVYIDFVDISYGTTPIVSDTGEETGLTMLGTDPAKGTFINGSFSLYFTKEDSQSDDEVEEWIQNNLDDLYLYSWLSTFSGLNQQVTNSELDLREIFFALSSAHRSNFTTASPAFPYVMEIMKDAFFNSTFAGTEIWRSQISSGLSEPASTAELMELIDTPGTWVYERFWGIDSMIDGGTAGAGPWQSPPDGWDYYRALAGEAGISNSEQYIISGISFMQTFIWRALYALIGTNSSNNYNVEGEGGAHFTMQKISDFANSDHYRKEGVYDENGDEIAVLINIPINFRVDENSIANRLDALGDIFIIAAVGRNVLDTNGDSFTGATHPGTMLPEFAAMNSALFNANFGDVTYEHILTGTGRGTDTVAIANPDREIFVSKSTNAPYNGMPIMSIDGTYHAAQPISQRRVITIMQQLLDNYAKPAKTDKKLRKNLNNLANVLQSKKKSMDLLPQLQLFRKTYPQKSTATTSGKLYEAFKKLLYSTNKSVQRQQSLKKIKITNNKVIDSRLKQPRVSYIVPTPNGGTTVLFPGIDDAATYQLTGDDFIPTKWFNLSRTSMKTVPVPGLLTEGAQFILEEGLPTTTTVEGDTVVVGGGGLTPTMWDHMAEFYDGHGEGEIGLGMSGRTFSEEFAEDSPFGPDEEWDPYAATTTDTVVQNFGYFQFDYEKAVHTQSKLAYVIPVWKLERFLGLHVPWEYYRVTEVTLSRSEAKFQTSMGRDWLGDIGAAYEEVDGGGLFVDGPIAEQDGVALALDNADWALIRLTAEFDPDKDYPHQSYSSYLYDLDNLRYGQPMVYLASSYTGPTSAMGLLTDFVGTTETYAGDSALEYVAEEESVTAGPAMAGSIISYALAHQAEADITETTDTYSYLTMVNFDTPHGAVTNNYSEHGWGASEDNNAPSGRLWDYHSWKVRGGYRLMTFEFKDFMDDDVAYYNTIGIGEFTTDLTAWDRSSLETNYTIQITVEDTSLRMVDDVYQIFKSNYDDFISNYYNLAIATCSFNNINDQFNEFFINGITEQYPAPHEQQWIRAPYMLSLAKNLFFRAGDETDDDTTTQEAIIKNAAQVAQQIGPHDGRLMHLNNFKLSYEKMLNIIKPQVDSTVTSPAEGRRLFGAKDHGDPRGNTPEYNYHPIYDQVLLQGGSEASTSENWGSSDDVNINWEAAITSLDEYNFSNTIPITEPIYGDMFLSALYAWDYIPPTLEKSFVLAEMIEFIRYLSDICDASKTSGEFPGLYDPTGGYTISYAAADFRDWEVDIELTQSGYKVGIEHALTLCLIYRYGRKLEEYMGLSENGLHAVDWLLVRLAINNICLATTGETSYEIGLDASLLLLQNGWRDLSGGWVTMGTTLSPFQGVNFKSNSEAWNLIYSAYKPVVVVRKNPGHMPSAPMGAGDFGNCYYKSPLIIYNMPSMGPEDDGDWIGKISWTSWKMYSRTAAAENYEKYERRAQAARHWIGASDSAREGYWGEEGDRSYGPIFDSTLVGIATEVWYIYPGGQHDTNTDSTVVRFIPPPDLSIVL